MYKSGYLVINIFILVFSFVLVFGYLSLGLSCFVVTFSLAKVSGRRRILSVVWAI